MMARRILVPAMTALLLGAVLASVAPAAGVQLRCEEPALDEAQLRSLVAKARASRKDLPAAPADYTTVVRRQGCHYTYIEYELPRAPEKQNIFTLNQKGVIVDTQPATMKCPEQELPEAQLAAIVEKARAVRGDLPAPFGAATTRVGRMRCLYLYFEYADPPSPGNFQVFTIDPFGELIDAYRNRR